MSIEVRDLHKSFGDKLVLDGVDFLIPEASVYGLVGKNGAGKTTLLNIISGITEADAGSCTVFGEKIHRDYYSSGVLSYLPDMPGFYDHLTVREYIRFILSGNNHSRGGILKEVEERYAALGMDGNARIKTLSRGNRQKLGIFSAVTTNPRFLILDEPTSALDPIGRRDVLMMIKSLRDNGMTILLSTHILSDLELVCDKIGFLHNGRILKEIDMDPAGCDSESFEISFAQSIEDTDCRNLTSALPGFRVELASDNKRIICRPISDTSGQSELFAGISAAGVRISSVKRTAQTNLEEIMMEVLSR